jgi:broad specificity phosphatase PhoE
VAVLLAASGSMPGSTGLAATERTEETLVLVRHGEKPLDGLGQLSCQGLNRALALPRILTEKFGRPAFIFAPNPQKQTNDKGHLYDYIRPLATIEPTAIQLGLPVNTQFGFRKVKDLRRELMRTKYQGALVFIAWEHTLLASLVKDLVAQGGGDPSKVPAWEHDDFDSIYVVKLTRVGDRLSAVFTRDREGLNNQSPKCP